MRFLETRLFMIVSQFNIIVPLGNQFKIFGIFLTQLQYVKAMKLRVSRDSLLYLI